MFTMSSHFPKRGNNTTTTTSIGKFWTSLSLDTWSWEWLSIAFSVFCFIATVGLLLAYHNSLLPPIFPPSWPNPEHYRHHNK